MTMQAETPSMKVFESQRHWASVAAHEVKPAAVAMHWMTL